MLVEGLTATPKGWVPTVTVVVTVLVEPLITDTDLREELET